MGSGMLTFGRDRRIEIFNSITILREIVKKMYICITEIKNEDVSILMTANLFNLYRTRHRIVRKHLIHPLSPSVVFEEWLIL